MSITDIIVRVGRIRKLEDQLRDLFVEPKLSLDEANAVIEARDYLRDYADELESKIHK